LPYQDISANELEPFLNQKAPVVIDMRDAAAQVAGLLPNAQPASDALVSALVKRRHQAPPVLVYCYHGNTSRDLCTFLTQFGLPEVYNLGPSGHLPYEWCNRYLPQIKSDEDHR
jgi:thiosulfate sulfurtransferase